MKISQFSLYYSFRIFVPKLLPIRESELGGYGNKDIEKLAE